MKTLVLLETALKAIKKNTRRSLLTMLGLIIGTAAVITIVSVGRGYEKYQMNQLLSGSNGDTIQTTISFSPTDSSFNDTNLSYFNVNDMDLISQINGVRNVEYEEEDPEEMFRKKQVIFQEYQQSVKMKLIGSEGNQVSYGRTISREDHVNRNKVVILSSDMAKEMDEDIEELIGRSLKIGSETFLIVGIYEANMSNTYSMQVPTASYEYYFGASESKNLTVTIDSKFSSRIVGKQIVELLTEQGSMRNLGAYSNSSGAAMVDSLSSLFQSLTLLISFVGAISLFISGVGVMNMIYTSVSERTKEIGIRRAMGATEQSIQIQFLFEGLTLTLIGGMIGYIIGLLIAKLISIVMNFDFIPDLFTAGLAIIISVLVGLIFSYFPSRSATEKDIVELVK